MVGFIIGVILGSIVVASVMSVMSMSREDRVDILLYDRGKVTVEDCDIMRTQGYTAVLDGGELLGFTKED